LFTAIASPVVIAASFGVALAGLFAYDASTYRHKHLDKVNVADLAVEPERGGPKQLKIARALVDDDQDEQRRSNKDKQRLVIVGGGWGVSAAQRQTRDLIFA
jgi:NADH dehydrogenase